MFKERDMCAVLRTSRSRRWRAFALFLLSFFAVAAAYAAAPQKIMYQGTLRRSGSPYTGNVTFVFRLTNQGGGAEYWTSGSTVVAVTGGLFRYPLGETNTGGDGGFPSIDWANITPYIEVTADATTLLPREPLASVPYALSGSGDNLGNHTATAVLQMGAYGVNTSSDITAARYQINGSTVLALLPGTGSLGVGAGAGQANSGAFNLFAGYEAGYGNTTGNYNAFAGYLAGRNVTIGAYNAMFGAGAGQLSSGGGGAFFGSYAGYKNTADANSFIGSYAGYNNTSGSDNSFMGAYAGYTNVDGIQNTFMGRSAGYNNTSGDRNSFFGQYAGQSNTTGTQNSFVGSYAGYANATGGYNVAVGRMAGSYNVAGGSNTAVGHQAGAGTSGKSYEGNSLFGYQAGTGLDTGSRNTLLGWQAGDSITTGSDNLIIGYGQDASAAAASSELNIGGLLYGDLAAKTIGISTRAPQAALDIVSTGTLVSQYAQIWRASDGTIVSSMTATGKLYTAVPPAGDNLGNHTATQNLDMANFPVVNVSSLAMIGSGIRITTSVFSGASGIIISTGGAIQTTGLGHPPSGTPTAGNARGMGAVDLQTARESASHVASGVYSAVLGGSRNTASGQESVVSGGAYNMVSGIRSIVGGGSANTASGDFAIVGGGYVNTASGDNYATVSGGERNLAGARHATVGGGEYNTAIGQRSVVPGGSYNTAKGDYSFAAGRKSSATAQGAFALSDSQNAVFEVGTADQFGARFQGGYLFSGGNVEVAGQIKISGGTPGAGKVLTSDAAGLATWGTASGDNLGNHTATQALNLASFNMVNVSSVNFRSNVFITSATAAQSGGVYVSTNLFVAGISTATAYYGNGSYLNNVSTNPIRIGDSYGGGVVFWVDPKGSNALIAPTADHPGTIAWSNDASATGATRDGVYAGKANTVMISTMQGSGTYAARFCLDYAVTVNGMYYDDWYLPSKTEMELVYGQRALLGGLSNAWYPTSTEYSDDPTFATFVHGGTGSWTVGTKTAGYYFRCVRGGPVSAFDQSRNAETARQLYAAPNVVVSSETSAALGAGVRVSSNVYIVGFSSAAKYYGDGSGLTNLPVSGDNLGNHTAAQALNLANKPLDNVSSMTVTGSGVTAADMLFRVAGSTMVILNNGNVGIGTVNPLAALHISGAPEAATAPILVVSSGVSAGQELFWVQKDGYVGMGTTAPDRKLHLYDTSGNQYGASVKIDSSRSDAFSRVLFSRQGTDAAQIRLYDFGGVNSLRIEPSATGSRIVAIDRGVSIGYGGSPPQPPVNGLLVNGDVGISTNAPEGRLDVKAGGSTPADMATIWRDGDGTIVSSVSATGVMMAAKFVGDGSSLTNISANAGVYTLAQMNTLVPAAAGRLISVSDASAPYSYCVSTGTAAGAWVLLNQTQHCQ